ncbi:hypothetical protein ACEPAG_1241 [Sanghuangporus baumii]
MQPQQTTEIFLKLPDVESLAPFNWAGCNPLFSHSKRESTEWMLSHGVFSDHKGSRLHATHPELLGAYVYPYADTNGLRIATDLLTILFTVDEVTDAQGEQEALATRHTCVKALTDESIDDTSPIAVFTRDYIQRLSSISTEVLERFVPHFTAYMDATTREAGHRANGKIPTLEDHIKLRRDNGGLRTAFDVIEVVLGITLPPEVYEDRDFQSMVLAANDMICYANDIFSYAKEYADGLDGCNSIMILMHEQGLSHQDAIDEVGKLYRKCADTFLICKETIRSFGPEVDEMVGGYVYGMEQWVAGHNAWNMETRRFFTGEADEMRGKGMIKITSHRKSIA